MTLLPKPESESVAPSQVDDGLEASFPDGISTQQVVDLFVQRGERLSEATFRKYVQLGLLPRSVRVGRKGKHRGSQGLYPVSVVRQIELIRRLMASGYTINEIQNEFLLLGTDIEGVSQQLKSLLSSIEEAAVAPGDSSRADEVVGRALGEVRELSDVLVTRLWEIERRLAMRARMARAAV